MLSRQLTLTQESRLSGPRFSRYVEDTLIVPEPICKVSPGLFAESICAIIIDIPAAFMPEITVLVKKLFECRCAGTLYVIRSIFHPFVSSNTKECFSFMLE